MYFTQVIVAKHVTGCSILSTFDWTTMELHALILKPPILMRCHVDNIPSHVQISIEGEVYS